MEEVNGNSLAFYRDMKSGKFIGMGGWYVLYKDGVYALAWHPNFDDDMRNAVKSSTRHPYQIERIPANINVSP